MLSPKSVDLTGCRLLICDDRLDAMARAIAENPTSGVMVFSGRPVAIITDDQATLDQLRELSA